MKLVASVAFLFASQRLSIPSRVMPAQKGFPLDFVSPSGRLGVA